MSGCSDLLGDLNRPNYQVFATVIPSSGYVREGHFLVQVRENVAIHIEARSGATVLPKDGVGEAVLDIPDGTWDISYTVGGYHWASHDRVRFDASPPVITGLEPVGLADATRHYRLGDGAKVTGAVSTQVFDLADGRLIATALPVDLNNLADGLHAYLVSTRDAAGNYGNVTVQVRVGTAQDLPEGQYTFGVVARYTNDLRLWDISDLDAYVTISVAKQQTGGKWMGLGFGVDPNDPNVKAVVAQVVTPTMTTAERAQALLRYMMENLHYDKSRLDNDFLLTPSQVLLDGEDSTGRDCPADSSASDPACDGLVMDGAGNGVKGGICRDLAATYVSLLRAAGVPARLVTGYLSGNVDGFHAWVEFYGGVPAGKIGQSPWIPVDVSGVDGSYEPFDLLRSFAIQRPDYLTLRQLPDSSEVEGWSTSLAMRYVSPAGQKPVIKLQTDVQDEFTRNGVLCVDKTTLRRAAADDDDGCTGFPAWVPDFPLSATRVIDYGIDVESAPRKTQVTAEVAYPFPEGDNPVYLFYGESYRTDSKSGKATADFFTT